MAPGGLTKLIQDVAPICPAETFLLPAAVIESPATKNVVAPGPASAPKATGGGVIAFGAPAKLINTPRIPTIASECNGRTVFI